jgi:hypothetical protein
MIHRALHADDAAVVLAEDGVDAPPRLCNSAAPAPPKSTRRKSRGTNIRRFCHRNESFMRAMLDTARGRSYRPYRLRFRLRMLGSMPNTDTAMSIVGVLARIRRTCLASSSLSVTVHPISIAHGGRDAPTCARRSKMATRSPVPRMTPRSIAWRSSRLFLGRRQRIRAARAPR